MKNELTFLDIVFSWGTSILALVAVIWTIVNAFNGHVDGFVDGITQFAQHLIYAIVYVALRMIPAIDERPPFYPKKKSDE